MYRGLYKDGCRDEKSLEDTGLYQKPGRQKDS